MSAKRDQHSAFSILCEEIMCETVEVGTLFVSECGPITVLLKMMCRTVSVLLGSTSKPGGEFSEDDDDIKNE